MNIKTITSTEGVNEVNFGSGASRFYWFRNVGTTTVHVSANADITAGSDGVAELAAGDSVCIETLGGKVYVLGAGKVQIHNTGDKFCPFKIAPAQSGGEAVDVDAYTKAESDARYPLITDVVPYKMGMDFGTCTSAASTTRKTVTTLNKIAPKIGAVFAVLFNNDVPANAMLDVNNLSGYIQYRGGSLPKGIINAGNIVTFMYYSNTGFNRFEILSVENGGNANTVGGYTVERIFKRIDGLITDANNAKESGSYTVDPGCLNVPTGEEQQRGIITVESANNDAWLVQTFTRLFVPCTQYMRIWNYEAWGDWKEISTTPMKSTTISGTTNAFADLMLFPVSDKKIPVFVAYGDVYCTPCLSPTGYYYAHMVSVYGYDMKNVAINSVTVYYIQT